MAKTFTITTTVTVDEDGQVVGQSHSETVATAVPRGSTSTDFTVGDRVCINGDLFCGSGQVLRIDAEGSIACRTGDGRKIRYDADDLRAGKVVHA